MSKKIPQGGYYLFKSCYIGMEFPGAESSTKFVFDKLGIDYYDDPRQSCCSGMGMNLDVVPPITTALLAARNFTLANESGHPYFATICSTCYGVNKEVCEWVEKDPKLYNRVNTVLQEVGLDLKKAYLNPENVFHAAEVFYQYRDRIKEKVVVDFKDIKIATHHGCHFFKIFPEDVVGDPEYVQVLDEIVRNIGAESISWYSEKNYCCGSGFRHRWITRDLARAAAYDKLTSVKQEGAEVLVNMCPMCHFQFDRSDALLEKHMAAKLGIIHLNIAQLLALSMGADPYEVVGIQTHLVKVEPLLKKLNII
jgi:heterodisulfide reductase subunit B